MTARAAVADVLAAHLPADVTLVPYSRQIDTPSASTVMVRLDTVAPAAAARGFTTYTFGLVLIAGRTSAGAGDDELEQLLEDVLTALDHASPAGITWSTATRSTYNDTNPAFEVAIAVTVTKE